MIFTGVLINAVLVIIGTMIGLIFKGERLKNIGNPAYFDPETLIEDNICKTIDTAKNTINRAFL